MTSKPKNMKDGLYSDKHLDLYLQEVGKYRWVVLSGDWNLSSIIIPRIHFGGGLQSKDRLALPMELFL